MNQDNDDYNRSEGSDKHERSVGSGGDESGGDDSNGDESDEDSFLTQLVGVSII